MKFTPKDSIELEIMLNKLGRYFAYKYEVEKSVVAFVMKGKGIYVMVGGQLKESIIPRELINLRIYEEAGVIKKTKIQE
jgi:hypothetical protein